ASVVASAPITIAGLATQTAVVKVASGDYNVNGGAFTTADGVVKNGDVVIVRQTSAATLVTKSTATLTVGDYAAPFDVTTIPHAFTPVTDAPLASMVASNTA